MQATLWVERLAGRESNPAERARMFQELGALTAPQFVFLGDMVSASTNREWRLLDTLLSRLQENESNVATAVGNHDIMFSRTRGLRALRERGLIPTACTWHTADRDGIRVLILDTNPRELKGAACVAQLAWFRGQLQCAESDPSVRAVVVVGHHPPMTNARLPHTAMAAIQSFCDAFETSEKTCLWASGHVHAYERFLRSGKHYVVAGTSGGPRVGLHRGSAMRVPAALQLPTPSPFLWLELSWARDSLHLVARGFPDLESDVQIWDQITFS